MFQIFLITQKNCSKNSRDPRLDRYFDFIILRRKLEIIF